VKESGINGVEKLQRETIGSCMNVYRGREYVGNIIHYTV
jgi:hypothetical protein